MMRSARLRLPSHMRRPTRRVTLRLLYFGSGTTMRCGTVPRRGIGSMLLYRTIRGQKTTAFRRGKMSPPSSVPPDSAKGTRANAPAPHSSEVFPYGARPSTPAGGRSRGWGLAASTGTENIRQCRRGRPRTAVVSRRPGYSTGIAGVDQSHRVMVARLSARGRPGLGALRAILGATLPALLHALAIERAAYD